MHIKLLIEYLNTLPDNMEVYVQTVEGDLLSPMELRHIWQTNAFVDSRHNTLEQLKLVITSFVEGQKSYTYKNDKRGYEVIDSKDVEEKQK